MSLRRQIEEPREMHVTRWYATNFGVRPFLVGNQLYLNGKRHKDALATLTRQARDEMRAECMTADLIKRAQASARIHCTR